MTIKQVCEQFGLTPDTLRYYEKIGVIPGVSRTSGGVRCYDETAVNWVENASGVTDSSLKYHLINAKSHGVTRREIAAVITHTAFYAGWPKGWAVFNLAKEVWPMDEEEQSANP